MKLIKTVGVVGAGTMGAALAQKFAQEGFSVILADRETQFVEKGLSNIRSVLNEGIAKKVFTEEQVNKYISNIKGTSDLHDLKACDLIVEAIFEDLKAKNDLFKTLDGIVNKKTILATNTSSFSVNELARSVSYPERFIGLHYFYHAAKNRLVEIIPGEKTSSETFEAAKIFSMRSGKDAITCKDSYGFVVNRFFVPWLNESVRLLDESVANIPTIDDVCVKTFGINMGPFALMNATGVPVAYHAQKTLEVFGSFYLVSEKLKKQAESKQLWNPEGEISQDEVLRKYISERMTGVVFLVCSQLLDEKVCTAADINRGARIGLRWRKGPVEMMQQYGENEVIRLIKQIADTYNVKIPASIGEKFWKISFVEMEKKGKLAVITMNRPEDLNALNEGTVRHLDEKFSEADNDPEMETIYIIGSGKAFVAGADIKFFVKNIKSHRIGDIESFTEFGQKVFNRIDNSHKKVVAIINGLALGGGLELALSADMIFALPKAQLAFPETGIGIYPGLGGTQRCAKRIGKGLSKYLIHTGKMLSAGDAEEIGLVDKIISTDEMFDILSGKQSLPAIQKKPLNEKWQRIKNFFDENSLSEILEKKFSNHSLSKEEAEKIVKTISFKAPVALRIADKLIEEAKGCESELDHLKEIFSTLDALLGLTSIGKRVEYSGK